MGRPRTDSTRSAAVRYIQVATQSPTIRVAATVLMATRVSQDLNLPPTPAALFFRLRVAERALGLADARRRFGRVRLLEAFFLAKAYSTPRTVRTTLSTLIPSFSATTAPGAEAPKRSIPTLAPVEPTMSDQPKVTPASMLTRGMSAGKT